MFCHLQMMDCPNFDPDDHNMTAVIQDEMEEGADFFFLFKSKKSFPQSPSRTGLHSYF